MRNKQLIEHYSLLLLSKTYPILRRVPLPSKNIMMERTISTFRIQKFLFSPMNPPRLPSLPRTASLTLPTMALLILSTSPMKCTLTLLLLDQIGFSILELQPGLHHSNQSTLTISRNKLFLHIIPLFLSMLFSLRQRNNRSRFLRFIQIIFRSKKEVQSETRHKRSLKRVSQSNTILTIPSRSQGVGREAHRSKVLKSLLNFFSL